MKASTLPLYLIGSRRAILDIASSRWSLLIGAIFVLSAGFAREYDGEDLLGEPWHALRPLAASLVSGTVLFLLVHCASLLRRHSGEGEPPESGRAYGSFLALFWMTAPMAWLYAIPYERMMDPVEAIKANLWTLGVVAAWRVLLMVRVVHVLYGIGYIASFFLVMLFANFVAFLAILIAPTPVIDVMGGIRHSEREALISSITTSILVLTVLSAPVWILGSLISLIFMKPRWANIEKPEQERPGGLLAVALASVVAFVPLLVWAQPEQRNRAAAERLLNFGQEAEGLAFMSEREARDFPPQWDPPPQQSYWKQSAALREIRMAMEAEWPADWVAEIYLAKIERALQTSLMPWSRVRDFERIIEMIEDASNIEKLAAEHAETALFLVEHLPTLREEEREALRRFAAMRDAGGN